MSYTSKELVAALYWAVFNREPDNDGLRKHAESLETGAIDVSTLAEAFFNSEEHRLRICGSQWLHDYTQFEELRHMLRILLRTGSRHELVVDVGARGKERSNSYNLLKDFGWRGLLIEANPMLGNEIKKEFSGLDFELVNCAIGDEVGRMPFYIGVNDDVSSLLPDHATNWGAIRDTIQVEVRRLFEVLDEHKTPKRFDVLSLDIEGMDVRVLNDLVESSEYRPRLVVIEASYNHQTRALSDVGLSREVQAAYRLAARTPANLILTASC